MRKRTFDVGWQRLFSTQGAISFLVAMLGIGFLHDSLYTLVFNPLSSRVGETGAAVILAVIGLIILFLVALYLGKSLTRAKPPETYARTKSPDPKRGLILLVSSEGACRTAINHHQDRLEYIWLIHSDKTKDLASNLKEEQGAAGRRVELIPIHTFEEPLEYYDKVKAVYRHPPHGMGTHDIILDFTGMSKSGSVGSVLASLDFDAPLQYTPAVTKPDGTPTDSKPPIEIVLRAVLGVSGSGGELAPPEQQQDSEKESEP